MTISLDDLWSAIDRPNGSLHIVNVPSYSTPPHHTTWFLVFYAAELSPKDSGLACRSVCNAVVRGNISQNIMGPSRVSSWSSSRMSLMEWSTDPVRFQGRLLVSHVRFIFNQFALITPHLFRRMASSAVKH